MKRDVLNSPRLTELKKHRQRTILNKILISLLGFAIIFSFLVYLSRLNNLNINEIEISGNKVLDTEIVRATAEELIAGKYLWLFPKTNIFLYPANNIKSGLFNKFKRLKDINLSVKNNKILEISLTERIAQYTWCGPIPTATEENCYFTDESGYIFDEAPYFSGNVYFKFYGNVDNPIGSYFLKQNFKQLISFKDILIDLGLKPVALYITTDGDIQVFLSGGTTLVDTPKIILKENADFQNVAENLQAALNTEPLQSKFKNNYAKLQYIDLRFGNKVYDKFSN